MPRCEVARASYVVSGVAAGVSPAVEPGILPGGTSPRIPQNVAYFQIAEQPGVVSGRQDAALYGSQDGRRYAANQKHTGGTPCHYSFLAAASPHWALIVSVRVSARCLLQPNRSSVHGSAVFE